MPNDCSRNFTSYAVLNWWGYQSFHNGCDTLLLLDNFDIASGALGVAFAGVCAITLPVCATLILLLAAEVVLDHAIINRQNDACGDTGVSIANDWFGHILWIGTLC